ncbi:hypothetical protein BN961_02848 [Afipia felis]|uniref:Uncharacterized protein n=1 Tax=Afipia felis TaxID=1035 RepID=A0A090MTC1_AFIFE|nr:hypothetical protein BN961_02848 [Afipia felis]
MSCAPRDSLRTRRPKATSGSTISGIAASTKPDSLGLDTTIIAAAPTNNTRLRNAMDTDAPTADLIWVVSAVSRETSSPLWAVSKKDGDSRVRCLNTSLRRSATMRSPMVMTK